MEHQMSEETKSKEENVSPYKKISNSQFEDLINSLQSRGIDLSPEDKLALISDGIVVSRTREKTRRGWTTDDGDKVFPSLSFKMGIIQSSSSIKSPLLLPKLPPMAYPSNGKDVK